MDNRACSILSMVIARPKFVATSVKMNARRDAPCKIMGARSLNTIKDTIK